MLDDAFSSQQVFSFLLVILRAFLCQIAVGEGSFMYVVTTGIMYRDELGVSGTTSLFSTNKYTEEVDRILYQWMNKKHASIVTS